MKTKNQNTPNYENIRAALQSTKGKIFSLSFIKKSTGELREMSARLGVTRHLRGGSTPYKPKDHNLIIVFETSGGKSIGYKAIPVENIKKLVIEGKTYNFPE